MSPSFEQVPRSGVCYISEKITSFLRVFEYIRQVRFRSSQICSQPFPSSKFCVSVIKQKRLTSANMTRLTLKEFFSLTNKIFERGKKTVTKCALWWHPGHISVLHNKMLLMWNPSLGPSWYSGYLTTTELTGRGSYRGNDSEKKNL